MIFHWAFAAAKRLVKNGVKFVAKKSGTFELCFLRKRNSKNVHEKFHCIFHGNFHAQLQEKFSRQHFCKPCRDDSFHVRGHGAWSEEEQSNDPQNLKIPKCIGKLTKKALPPSRRNSNENSRATVALQPCVSDTGVVVEACERG